MQAAQRVEWKNKGAEAERNAYDHSGLSGWAPPDEPGRLVKDHKNMVSTFGPRQGPFVRTDSDTGANGKHEGFFINTQVLGHHIHILHSLFLPPLPIL